MNLALVAAFCCASLLLHCCRAQTERESFQQLFTDWVVSGYMEHHEFVVRSNEKYKSEPQNAHANNLMGILAHQKNDMILASKYFKVASEIVGYNDAEFLYNYVHIQNRINYVETIDALADALQKDVYNDVLYDELYATMSNLLDHHKLPHNIIVQTLMKLPIKYKLWMLLVTSILRSYVPLLVSAEGEHRLQITQPNVAHLGDLSAQKPIVTYGLTMFPRAPELLLISSIMRYYVGELQCAERINRAAAAAQEFNWGNVTRLHFDLYQELLRSSSATDPMSAYDEAQCLPILSRHRTAEYQYVHREITTSLLRPGWSSIANVTIKGSTDTVNQLVRDSVAQAAFIDPDGTASTIYLPSLQVGCSNYNKCARPGFLVADALASPSTHFVTLAYDLSMVESASVGLLYSSHTLEHLSHNLPPPGCALYPVSNRSLAGCSSELDTALAEWRRVLAQGGKLLLSVPDIMALASYFIRPGASAYAKAVLRNIFFGGQVNQHDFHKTGFYFEALQEQLASHGFCDVQRVQDFGIFQDTSSAIFYFNESISLNVMATACV